MAERHQEYVKDLKLEALRETGGPETPATQAKLEELDALSQRAASPPRRSSSCARSRCARSSAKKPAIRALLAKIARRIRSTSSCTVRPASARRRSRGSRSRSRSRGRYTPFAKDAPFVEASGTTLRWDPRETTNPLLGSVHDPIYQGSRREFAEGGIPEPKLGLVTRAHGGVLFIDEIGEMDPRAADRGCSKCSRTSA